MAIYRQLSVGESRGATIKKGFFLWHEGKKSNPSVFFGGIGGKTFPDSTMLQFSSPSRRSRLFFFFLSCPTFSL